jgi:hypothetical protein
MVAQPSEFAWSSHAANAQGRDDPALRPHPAYQSLGASAADRQLAYRTMFDEVLSADDISDIRAYIQQQRALGNGRFRAMVEQKLGRCASLRPPHRPPAPARALRSGHARRHSLQVTDRHRRIQTSVSELVTVYGRRGDYVRVTASPFFAFFETCQIKKTGVATPTTFS